MTNPARDGSFIVLFKDGKKREIFLIYRPDKDIWTLPGGGIEPGETPEQAVMRETYEESQFTLAELDYRGIHKNTRSDGSVWNVTYLFSSIAPIGSFIPEFDGNIGQWFAVTKLPLKIQSITALRINDALSETNELFIKDFTVD